MAVDLSVVVPSRDREMSVLRLLQALERQQGPAFEVVVVEDRERPTYRIPRGRIPVRHVVSGGCGPACARNRGVSAARGPWILFLDDDVEPGEGLLSRVVETLRAWAPRPVGLVGRVLWHPDVPLNAFRWWLDHGGPLFAFYKLTPGERVPGKFLSTACFAASRDLLQRFPFDETFPFPAYEDWDLGLRLEQAGIPLIYRSDLVVWHRTYPTLSTYRARAWKVGFSRYHLVIRHPKVRTWVERVPGGVWIAWGISQITGRLAYPLARLLEHAPPSFAGAGRPWFAAVYRQAFFSGYIHALRRGETRKPG